jgi:phosphatidylglycerophosphatase C
VSLVQAGPQAIRYARDVQPETADEVWARIEAAARAEPTGVVATDADGTLWSGDVGEDLFEAFLEHGRVEPAALEALRRNARDHAMSDAGTGPDVARRIYAAYGERRFPEERACEVMVWCFAGWSEHEVGSFARDVVNRCGLESRLHGELRGVLERVRRAGIEAYLVSASPIAVVLEAGALLGFDETHVVAARPRYLGGVMLADVERPIPYGAGKVMRLRERIGKDRPILSAFGDNAFDVALLASARVPVAVRPKPRLRERAHEVSGLVELSRDSC